MNQPEEAMKKRAVENGLLEQADLIAQAALIQLLFADPAIKETYSIEFTPAE